jgi:flagellar biosynthesis protein FliP
VNLKRSAVLTLIVALLASPAMSQSFSMNFGEGGSLSAESVQLMAVLTVLSLAPGIAVTVTCFPFIVTVLSILRQAIGLQQAPPNMLIVSLSLFLTWFVMEPVFTEAWIKGIEPMQSGIISIQQAIPLIISPFRVFMAGRIDSDVFSAIQNIRPGGLLQQPAEAPLSLLIPTFMLSEIQRSFEIGFLIFLPFLIIDMVVAAVLMSMGMMMVPPAMVSLPFKLSFFVVASGWSLISGALVGSYF